MAGLQAVRRDEAILVLLDRAGRWRGVRREVGRAGGGPGDAQGRRCCNEDDENRCAQPATAGWLAGDGDLDFLVDEQNPVAGATAQHILTRHLERDRVRRLAVFHLDVARFERRVGRTAVDHPGDERATHGAAVPPPPVRVPRPAQLRKVDRRVVAGDETRRRFLTDRRLLRGRRLRNAVVDDGRVQRHRLADGDGRRRRRPSIVGGLLFASSGGVWPPVAAPPAGSISHSGCSQPYAFCVLPFGDDASRSLPSCRSPSGRRR